MSRPLYMEVLDGTFHATSRGNARRTIFEDEEDCRTFLVCLRHTIMRRGWRCLAYCLMVNHFHLLVQTPRGNLAAGMRDLKSGYATAFNARRGDDGSLFKKGFWRQLIQEDDYLLTTAVYIALNPVRAGRVSDPAEWPWSSFAATALGESGFVDADPFLSLLDPDRAKASRRFAELVNGVGGLPAFDPSLPIIGDKDFVSAHAPASRPGRHVAKTAWAQARPSLVEIQSGLSKKDFVREARLDYRYTLDEIATHLGCCERTIRRWLQMSDAGTRPL